jgi:hypothetical protein
MCLSSNVGRARTRTSKALFIVNMASVSKRKSGGGTLAACMRCHHRKQRCSGFPSCVNCQAAGVACKRESTPAMRRLAGLSKQDLIDQIVKLEDAVNTVSNQSLGERHQSIVTTSSTTDTPCQDQSPADATVVPEAFGPSSTHLFRVCADAAGDACQLFRILFSQKKLKFSFTMVNSVFVAGSTIWSVSWPL